IALLAVVAGMIVPVVANRIDDARLGAERSILSEMRRDFCATFDAPTFDLNESSLPQTGLPASVLLTSFDDPNSLNAIVFGSGPSVQAANWLQRLALKRGITTFGTGIPYGANVDSE